MEWGNGRRETQQDQTWVGDVPVRANSNGHTKRLRIVNLLIEAQRLSAHIYARDRSRKQTNRSCQLRLPDVRKPSKGEDGDALP